jgi:hypothetical protein
MSDNEGSGAFPQQPEQENSTPAASPQQTEQPAAGAIPATPAASASGAAEGAAPTGAAPTIVAPTPKPGMKRGLAITLAVVVVVVVVALAFIIPNFNKVKRAFGVQPSNAIAKTATALNSLSTASNGKLSFAGSFDSNGSTEDFSVDSMFSWGTTTDNSMLSLTASQGGNELGRVAWYKGAAAFEETTYGMRMYLSADQIKSALQSQDSGKAIWAAKNALIKDHRVDPLGALKAYSKALSAKDRQELQKSLSEATKNTPNKEESAQMTSFTQDFLSLYLEDSSNSSKVIKNETTTTSNGVTSLKYSIDVQEMVRAVSSYYTQNINSYPQLHSYLIKSAKSSGTKDLDAQMRKYQTYKSGDDGTTLKGLDITVKTTGANVLSEFDFAIDGADVNGSTGSAKVSIKASDINSLKVSSTDVEKFMKQAEEYQQQY